MKKLLLLISIGLCTAFYIFEKAQEGDLVISTWVNFMGGYGYGTLYSQGGINPGIQYVLTSKLALGASVNLSPGGVLRIGSLHNYNNGSFSTELYAQYYIGTKMV